MPTTERAPTEKAHDDIVRTAHARTPVRKTNTIAGRRLASNGEITVADDAWTIQPDET